MYEVDISRTCTCIYLTPKIRTLNLNYPKKVTRYDQSFSLSLCGPISISRANAHMVHMGLKYSTSHYTLFS